MGQILIRNLDDAKLARVRQLAREQRTSVEAMARAAVHHLADTLTAEEKRARIDAMQARFAAAMVPGVTQTPGLDLIREDRER